MGVAMRFNKLFAGCLLLGSSFIKQGVGQGGSARGVYYNAGAPTSGTSGTLANVCTKGDLLIDVTNGKLYLNTGTAASPTWTDNSAAAFTPVRTLADGLTAAGTTRADALVIAADVNNVTTATASTGAVLPAATAGALKIIYNGGASAIKVYATGTDTIDGTAGATGVTLTNAKRCEYRCLTAGAWISAQLGAVSA